MGDCRVSLLFQRAFGALEALHAGDGRPESGGLLEWTLALGTWLIERRGGRPPSADVITPGSAPPFPEPPAGLDLAQRVAGAGAAVGLARRPQDHNGVVDDAVSLVQPFADASDAIASAAAIAGFLSGLLDGWAMEGALAQSLFIAQRAEAFGAVKGPSVTAAIRAVFDEIYAGARSRFRPEGAAAGGRPAGGAGAVGALKTEKLAVHQLAAEALGLAYLSQDAAKAIAAAAGLDGGGRCLAAVAGMLGGAFAPASLPAEARAGLDQQTPVLEVVEDLLDLRTFRYLRVPQYRDRFRRKKC